MTSESNKQLLEDVDKELREIPMMTPGAAIDRLTAAVDMLRIVCERLNVGQTEEDAIKQDAAQLNRENPFVPPGFYNRLPNDETACETEKEKIVDLEFVGESATLEDKIRHVINSHNAESVSDTPDFILARWLINTLNNFNDCVIERDRWYGRPVGEGAALDYNRKIRDLQQGRPSRDYGDTVAYGAAGGGGIRSAGSVSVFGSSSPGADRGAGAGGGGLPKYPGGSGSGSGSDPVRAASGSGGGVKLPTNFVTNFVPGRAGDEKSKR